MKETICTTIGIIGSSIAGLFGGWNTAMAALIIFMAVDCITGWILAGVFRKSPKTNSGGLQSKIGWKGLAKKCVVLLLLLVAAQLDNILDTNYIRDAVCIAFMCNELLSILENAGLMGIPLPNALTKAIDLLQSKGKDD